MSQFQADKYQRKVEQAISQTTINDAKTCAKVRSTSQPRTFYIVEVENLYSVSCTCPATGDCCHRIGVDRMLDSERPHFYASFVEETVSVEQAMEEAQEAMCEIVEEAARKGEAVAMAKMVAHKLSSQYVAAPSTNDFYETHCANCGKPLKGSSWICGWCVGY